MESWFLKCDKFLSLVIELALIFKITFKKNKITTLCIPFPSCENILFILWFLLNRREDFILL